MMKRFVTFSCVVIPLFLLISCTKMVTLPPELATDAPVTMAPWGAGSTPGKSAAAFMEAAASRKHFFLYFYAPGKNDPKVRKIFDETIQKLGSAAQSYPVNVKDKTESTIVQYFRLDKAPLPLVLVVAPNAAVVGGFPKERINEAALMHTIASPNFQRVLRSLQEGKLVLICVAKSDPSKKGPQIPKGVLEFSKDPDYKDKVKIIAVDPNDPAESNWLPQLRIDPTVKDATTCILAPPGSLVAKLPGAIKKKDIIAVLTNPSQGRGPGGPGGPGGPSQQGGPSGPGGPSNRSVPPPSNPPQK